MVIPFWGYERLGVGSAHQSDSINWAVFLAMEPPLVVDMTSQQEHKLETRPNPASMLLLYALK